MRIAYFLIALTILGLVGSASAKPRGDETKTIDLTPVGGTAIYLRCSNAGATGVTDCGIASLFMESNGLSTLQANGFNTNGRFYDPDTKLLG